MTKEEIAMLGFEIVAYAGDARSTLFDAIKHLQNGEKEQANDLKKKAEELLIMANKSQLKLLQLEAGGNDIPYSFILMHGHDHLMTTVLLKDMFKIIENLYSEINKFKGEK